MLKASVLLLLISCGLVLGCETGSTAQNVSTTGWKGQKAGKSSNVVGPRDQFHHRHPGKHSGTPAKTPERIAQGHAESRQRLISPLPAARLNPNLQSLNWGAHG